jgi:hypothetical protein
MAGVRRSVFSLWIVPTTGDKMAHNFCACKDSCGCKEEEKAKGTHRPILSLPEALKSDADSAVRDGMRTTIRKLYAIDYTSTTHICTLIILDHMPRHLTAFIMFPLLRMSSLPRRIRRNLAKSEGDDSYQTSRRPHSRSFPRLSVTSPATGLHICT